MAYDTIRLRSPFFSPDAGGASGSRYSSAFEHIKGRCIRREGTDMDTGEQLYQLFSGQLLGSWDSRISVQPKEQEYQLDSKGRPRLVDCLPYLVVECSVHKAEFGQNVYGGSSDFRHCAEFLVGLLSRLLELPLWPAEHWLVQQVDVSHVYRLSPAAIREFFDGVQLLSFPRRERKSGRYATAVHFSGRFTTFKIYGKGPEFKEHDFSRLGRFFRNYFHSYLPPEEANKRATRRINALQRLADRTLRVEVSVHSDKFVYDYGRVLRVRDVTDEYLESVHVREVEKFLREGKQGMDTVRTTQQVQNRLISEYGQSNGIRLFGFWASLVTLGVEATKLQVSRSVFYRNRTHLEKAGVSWRGSDVHVVANDCALPSGFVPLPFDSRARNSAARARVEFGVNTELLRLAA